MLISYLCTISYHKASTPGHLGIAAIQDQKMDSAALLVQGIIYCERLPALRLPTYHQVCVLLLCQTRDVRHLRHPTPAATALATSGAALLDAFAAGQQARPRRKCMKRLQTLLFVLVNLSEQ